MIDVFGSNQFAYTPQRGARDALLYLILSWLLLMAEGFKIGLYCSDVSGAFDKVDSQRLVQKLKGLGIHPKLLAVFDSWLRRRKAQVVVSGTSSNEFSMENMIYQGTVWGPPFWNCYYADSKLSIRMNDFTEIIYADDLNAFKAYLNTISHEEIFADIDRCQAALHSWGRANKVTFDAGKESRHIISKTDPTDSMFHLLGVDFDCKLLINDATHSYTIAASWKLRSLLRTRRFYTGGDLIHMFKTHILSFIEYRTPVFMHAAYSSLTSLDRILSRFLEDIGVSNLDALLSFNLAPLATRRDIAALAVIYRAILKQDPSYFYK